MGKILNSSIWRTLFASVAALPLALPVSADESTPYVVAQENKAFSIDRLVIKAGERVRFPNRDPYFHNVFSLSSGAVFDLGSYPKGSERIVTFDESGTVLVECAIHPSMQMTIEVRE